MVPDHMPALVVHAHPDPDSFNHALAEAAVAGLRGAGREVVLVDLHADGFDPRMTAAERRAYETTEPILDPVVARYVDLLRAADTIVFVYPTWWFGMPATLKGFLDRVLVPGVGFRLDPDTRAVRPGLQHVRRLVGVTTYGSPRAYVRFFGDPGRRTVTRTLRTVCGLRCRSRWFGLYAIDTATADERAAFLDRVRREVGR
jgi:NAD(P)H dehydrogenase (quinone)